MAAGMTPRVISRSLFAIVLLGLLQGVAGQSYCGSDPYGDPQADVCNPLRYIPRLWAAILALSLYFIVAILLTIQLYRHGGKFFLCLVIGAYCEGFGLAMRIPFRTSPHSRGIYIVQYLFVVLSPCAFLAADYILLGRLTLHLSSNRHLRPLNPRKITLIFVLSDVATFLIQAAGGGLSISDNQKTSNAGQNIFLAGIALQFASFLIFTVLWAIWGWRVRRNDPTLWDLTWWKPLYWALGFTCIMFLIRSVFRTVELSQGYIGYLATHEPFFYFLDTLPLWLGISTYVYFWPTKYLTEERRIVKDEGLAMDHEVGQVRETSI